MTMIYQVIYFASRGRIYVFHPNAILSYSGLEVHNDHDNKITDWIEHDKKKNPQFLPSSALPLSAIRYN